MPADVTVAAVRKSLVLAVAGGSVVGIVVVAVLVWRLVLAGSSGGGRSDAECTVPALPGPEVTVVVEGPMSSGAGAAGQAELGASAAPATTVLPAPSVGLSAVALQNASTINAVGWKLRRPERARIIAVATAWQESRLRNLPNGDRDSVGLFQQRPSQGWGTAARIADPVYASGRFYDALSKVSGWEQMSLTRAAQEVQYSGFPDAYAQWEPQATTLVRALDGATPLELACRSGAIAPTAPMPARPALPGSDRLAGGLRTLLAGAGAELGGISKVSGSGGTATATIALPGIPTEAAGRVLAAWLVAHATGSGVGTVAVADRQYADHAWAPVTDGGGALPAGQVRITAG